MYQNVYYEKEKSIIHCWDDEKVTSHLSTVDMVTLEMGMVLILLFMERG